MIIQETNEDRLLRIAQEAFSDPNRPKLCVLHPGMTAEELVYHAQRARAEGKRVICSKEQFELVKHLLA